MPFEEFVYKGRPAQGHRPQIGVHAHGRVSLNEAAHRELDRPSHVVLLFDADDGRMALRASDASTPYAYPVLRPEGSQRYVVVASAFARHYGLKGSRTEVFEAHREGDLLVAQLSDRVLGRTPTTPGEASEADVEALRADTSEASEADGAALTPEEEVIEAPGA